MKNRQIKFRAFIDGEMILLPFAALQYFDFEGSYAMSFVVDGYSDFWAHECYERISKDRCANAPIMQFTGLHDRNGVEIYEGDVIKGGIYKAYEVKWDGQQVGFNIGNHVQHFYEVIGNIYEHPNLLTNE